MDDLHYWHYFSREELLGIVERDPVAVVDLAMALQKRVLELEERATQQDAVIKHLTQRIEQLEARLAQDSHNSHQPPSSQGYAKPAPKSLRESSGRSVGGQRGHAGHTLKAAARPDHTVIHPLLRCAHGHALRHQPVVGYDSHQVFDLPILGLEVTEHRGETKFCPGCETLVTAAFPCFAPASVQYGPRLQALIVYWRTQQLLPVKRICQMTEDLLGQPMSPATVEAMVARAVQGLDPFEKMLGGGIRLAAQLNADETGLRIKGRLHWLHVLSTRELTWYGVHPKRGQDAMEAFALLPNFSGRLIHDEFGPYWTYGGQHLLCQAHHLRELVFIAEQEHQSWGRRLQRLLERAQRTRHQQGCLTSKQARRYRENYDLIVNEASPPQGSKAHSLRRRFIKFKEANLAFLSDPSIPFTNNQAEQDLRMMKVQQKISGSFRTFNGARTFARLRSYISTMRKQGYSIWDGLIQALRGNPWLPAQASLPC